MKRFPRDLCNLEPRMRKKAALDQKLMMGKAERENKSAKKKQAEHMVSLGGDYFAYAACFKSCTYAHIRKFITDAEGWLQPTRDGLTMSPAVWTSLVKEICNFRITGSSDIVTILNKKLCVSQQTINGELVFAFQKLFQRKNLQFEFISNHVVLNRSQFTNLCDKISEISDQMKESFIKDSLQEYILSEMEQSKLDFSSLPIPVYQEVRNSLAKCIANAVTLKISKLCAFPETTHFLDMTQTRAENFNEYFELSLFQLDWQQTAKDFFEKNKHTNLDFEFGQDFFDGLNVKTLFKQIEKIYVSEEDTMYNDFFLLE